MGGYYKIKNDNPLDDTEQILDKLVKVGLTLDDISFLKTKISI